MTVAVSIQAVRGLKGVAEQIAMMLTPSVKISAQVIVIPV
jgi:hypothetical protein